MSRHGYVPVDYSQFDDMEPNQDVLYNYINASGAPTIAEFGVIPTKWDPNHHRPCELG